MKQFAPLRFAAALLGILLAAWTTATTASANSSPQPVDIGSSLQLFLDSRLIDTMNGARLRMHSPMEREVVFTFDAPWEGPECGYATVLKDGDRYRLYYRGGGELTEEVTCLAESDDAIHWARPNLQLFEYKGSKENNILWRGEAKAYRESHNFTPFIDANPAAAPDQRYKAVALGVYPDDKGDRRKMLVAMVSPDGIHWKRLQEDPVIRDGSFDSQNVAFWDTARGEYVCYSRIGVKGVRSVQRNMSKDFVHWSEGVPLDFGPGPLEQFYTNAIQPYFRNPSLYIGMPMRFVPGRKTLGADKRAVDGLSDGVLISSHDGLHFDRTFREAFIRPGPDPLNWGHAHGNNTPTWGLLPTSDTEISVYWAQHFGGTPLLRRGTLRTDGFASLHAPDSGGEAVTVPIRFTGKRLSINVSTSAVGSVRVEIQDADGKPFPGFAAADSEVIYGDEIDRAVSWEGGSDLSSLAGKTVRLRFLLRDADVYSFRFIAE